MHARSTLDWSQSEIFLVLKYKNIECAKSWLIIVLSKSFHVIISK